MYFIKFLQSLASIYTKVIIFLLIWSNFGFAINEVGTHINNQASIIYSARGDIQVRLSNDVNITIGTIPASLEFLRYSRETSDDNITIKPTRYLVKSSNKIQKEGDSFHYMTAPILANGELLDMSKKVSVVPAELYNSNDLVIIRVIDIQANQRRDQIDFIDIDISDTNNKDSERLRLKESNKDSGTFIGYIQLKHNNIVQGDGVISAQPDNTIVATYGKDGVVTHATLDTAKIIPDAKVFLSEDNRPLPNVEVMLLDPQTKEIKYRTITDSEGRYYFDDVVEGDYILYSAYVIEPEPIFNSDGTAIGGATLNSGYIPFSQEINQPNSGVFSVIDIPIDIAQKATIWIEKQASKKEVSVGEFIKYTLNIHNDNPNLVYNLIFKDFLPKELKYKEGTLRLNGVKQDVKLSKDGKIVSFDMGEINGKSNKEISYIAQVTTEANSKEITNQALVESNHIVVSNLAKSIIKFKRELFSDKGVIVGQIKDIDDKNSSAIMGVKLYMEDGSYVVSDIYGKYHFEGVTLGKHVVQVDKDILSDGYDIVSCSNSVGSNSSLFSKFIEFNHGSLKRVDFCIKKVREVKKSITKEIKKVEPIQEKMPEYSDSDVSHFSKNYAILYPKEGYIPNIPTTSLVILHPKNKKIEIWLNGEKVSQYNFASTIDGIKKKKRVTIYKGIDLLEGNNQFVVNFLDKKGKKVATTKRLIHVSGKPAKIIYRKRLSKLIADGKTSPIIAVQFIDVDGYPLRAVMQGSFSIDEPYIPQSRIESFKSDPLALSSHSDKFVIDSNGTAYIKLQPTSKSGEVKLYFGLSNSKKEIVKTWLKPKARDWIMVGFAEGTIGYETLSKNQESSKSKDKLYKDGKVAFFAKGKIKGSWLLSIAYNSGKDIDKEKLNSQIDPNKYYTIYGDTTQQNYEASTQKKIFVKIEKDNFYTLFGDFETGLTSTELTQYSRSFTGIKSEYHGKYIQGSAFASNSNQQFGRDEIRGDGTSGYYYLSKKNLIINSERITIEVRDRYNDKVLNSKIVHRYQDYDIDYTLGRLYFKSPIYSKDSNFNPRYIVATYEVKLESIDGYTYGGRVALKPNEDIEIGSNFVRENQGVAQNSMVGVDAKAKIGTDITLRAEYAQSANRDQDSKIDGSAKLVELEYIGDGINSMAYYREQDNAFGLGQLSKSLDATRKIGLDVTKKFNRWFIATHVFRDESLESGSFSDVVQMNFGYTDSYWNNTIGYRYTKSDRDSGANQIVTMLSRSMFDHKVRLSIGRDQTIGKEKSKPYPTKTVAQASYSISPSV